MDQPVFKITAPILEATLNYLSTRPYREIAQLIAELSKLEQIKAEEPKAPESKEPEN